MITCRLHGVDPYTYLVDVLQRVAEHPRSRRRAYATAVEKRFAESPLQPHLWGTSAYQYGAGLRLHSVQPFTRSGAQCTQGRELLRRVDRQDTPIPLLMDRAYEGDETRQLALELGFIPVVPPMKTRVNPWEYDRELYKRRNEVERLFRRLKGFRRIFSRFEKLDVMFLGFISFALIADGLRMC